MMRGVSRLRFLPEFHRHMWEWQGQLGTLGQLNKGPLRWWHHYVPSAEFVPLSNTHLKIVVLPDDRPLQNMIFEEIAPAERGFIVEAEYLSEAGIEPRYIGMEKLSEFLGTKGEIPNSAGVLTILQLAVMFSPQDIALLTHNPFTAPWPSSPLPAPHI